MADDVIAIDPYEASMLQAERGVVPREAATKGPSFADDALLIQAAMARRGLAVVRDVYANDQLAADRLMLAIDATVIAPIEYFVVARSDRLRIPKIAAFREWIVQQAGIT